MSEKEKQPSNATPRDGAQKETPLTIDEVRHVAEMMIMHGDGFFSNLGHAIRRGTEKDIRKIRETWPDKWNYFKNMKN